jgi:hypothetical protein
VTVRVKVMVPLDLVPDDIDDLVRQAGDVLVAQVNRDARLLLLQLPGRLGGGAVVDVLAGVLEGRLGQGHHLVVRDGLGHVVAHCERARGRHSGGTGTRAGAYIVSAVDSDEKVA